MPCRSHRFGERWPLTLDFTAAAAKSEIPCGIKTLPPGPCGLPRAGCIARIASSCGQAGAARLVRRFTL
ncbi:hypothetical protein CHELA40_14701 [Chelatococcus asaccharovorans]|nr:hypothetical protein CHELA17_60919 [Chelatococcus asaccharovorans]CAH1679370.1 hypothetical protein CHELA40_14701 [Chelatococcus asaccharovorans]